MASVSVVIICLNAIDTIKKVVDAALLLTDDVIVVDTGSTDGTQQKISKSARLITSEWLGFGNTKNKGNQLAGYDWILSLDADEVLSENLINTIKKLDPTDKHTVYSIKLLNYFGDQPIKYGEWQNNWVKRLFNRQVVRWDASPVHEKLTASTELKIVKLHGLIHHYTTTGIDKYKLKLDRYADLMAEKRYKSGKKATWVKSYIAPAFNFIKNYFFNLGILDKKAGWQIAKAHAMYTYMKYKKLHQLHRKNTKDV